MTISRFDSFLFNKYLILRLIVFLSLIILNSPSFSAPNYSGDCSFYISRNGVKFEQAGYAFMTYKRDNKALKVRGNISLSKRHIIGTTHTAIYNDNTSINAKTGDQAVLEIKNEINSNKLLVQCGDITFNVERNTLASKPLISGLKQVSSTSTQECITSGDDPEFSVFERGIIRQGCDLSVYEIDLSSIKQNGKSATPDVLDKITGFAPLFLDRKDEFNSALILDKETGKYISCPISHSMRGSITMQCKDKNKLDRLKYLYSHKLISSGTTIVAENPKAEGQPIYYPQSKIPAALGVLTKVDILDNNKSFYVTFDLISVSKDYLINDKKESLAR